MELADDQPTITVDHDEVLDASNDEVWDALTDAEQLSDWLGAEVDLDVAPGSVGRVVDEDGTVREVLVTVVEPGERIGWHWWDDRGELSSVEITLSPTHEGTRIRVIEILVPSAHDRGLPRAEASASGTSTDTSRRVWGAGAWRLVVRA